mmetsp:Transcript_36594/g.103196  ORF Transcript_36594/g.103196 Transcript_36594/m.103196 type:complete len:224 (-) Transcript_36594:550-1221(-)
MYLHHRAVAAVLRRGDTHGAEEPLGQVRLHPRLQRDHGHAPEAGGKCHRRLLYGTDHPCPLLPADAPRAGHSPDVPVPNPVAPRPGPLLLHAHDVLDLPHHDGGDLRLRRHGHGADQGHAGVRGGVHGCPVQLQHPVGRDDDLDPDDDSRRHCGHLQTHNHEQAGAEHFLLLLHHAGPHNSHEPRHRHHRGVLAAAGHRRQRSEENLEEHEAEADRANADPAV